MDAVTTVTTNATALSGVSMDAVTTVTTNATALSGVSEFLNELWAYIVSEIPFWQDILLPALWDGLIVTLQLVVLTAPFGFLLGLLVAVARVYGVKPVRWAAQLYVIFSGSLGSAAVCDLLPRLSAPAAVVYSLLWSAVHWNRSGFLSLGTDRIYSL